MREGELTLTKRIRKSRSSPAADPPTLPSPTPARNGVSRPRTKPPSAVRSAAPVIPPSSGYTAVATTVCCESLGIEDHGRQLSGVALADAM